MKRLLIVEDEEVILKALTRLLERNHYDVQCATTVDEALATPLNTFDLILADLRLPGEMGTALIPFADSVPVVIMTSHASVRSAVDAMRHGAIDYIAKPFDHDELLMVIERSLHQNLLQSQNRALKLTTERLAPIRQKVLGTALDTLLDEMTTGTGPNQFIHIYGELGTHREALAAALHASGPYKDGPFLVLDTDEISLNNSMTLLGSMLAQPTADSDSERLPCTQLPSGGYLQAAQNGTLVIRSPERLQSDVQQSLCSAIVGNILKSQSAGQRHSSNLSVISISEKSIDELLDQGQLTNGFAEMFTAHQYEVPPLRERTRDIAILTNRHLSRMQHRYGVGKFKLSVDAEAALQANDWQGNTEELESVLSRAVFLCRTHTIGLSDLGFNANSKAAAQEHRDFSLDEYFRFFVLRNQNALSETELASRLGISRKALWERRQKMSLLRETNADLG